MFLGGQMLDHMHGKMCTIGFWQIIDYVDRCQTRCLGHCILESKNQLHNQVMTY